MQDASGWVEALLQDLDSGPDAEFTDTTPGVGYSKVLGRNVRVGPWADQKISTFEKIRAALDRADGAVAAAMLDVFMDEASVIFSFFRQLVPDAMAYLNLVYRRRADFDCNDPSARTQDVASADKWSKQAAEIRGKAPTATAPQ